MGLKKELILFGLATLFVVAFNFNTASAGTLCADDQIILRLSSATNAHGEVWNGAGNYPVEICYDLIFGSAGDGDRTCTGNNKIVGLSANTNAHSQNPTQFSYPVDVCYGNVSCIPRIGGCLPEEYSVVSQSDNTNAHLANDGSYSIDICCQADIPPPAPCTLDSASWKHLQTVNNYVEDLEVSTTGCEGLEMSFVVKEDDALSPDEDVSINPVNVIVNAQGKAESNWTAEWQPEGFGETDPPEFYFIATLVGTSTEIISSNLLEVFQIPPPECSDIVMCEDYGDQDACFNDLCAVAINSVPSDIDCSDPERDCQCYWNTTTMGCEGSWVAFDINDTIFPPSKKDAGLCHYTTDSTDTCEDDGYRSVIWTAWWDWNPTCDIDCQNKPENIAQKDQCEAANGRIDAIKCPAEIALPFFTWYNALAILVIIGIVYWVLESQKGKKRRKNKR